jgi:UDP-glucose 4-epimerase
LKTLITGGCGFVGRHLTNRLLRAGHDVWIVDDLSTGLHPDRWLQGFLERTAFPSAVKYQLPSGQSLTFVHEDVILTLLRQLGLSPADGHLHFPPFDYVFALASIVGGRTKIDGDPIGVGLDLAIDSLFYLWVVRNREKVGRVLYASSSAAYPINLQKKDGHVALEESMIDFATGDLGQPDMTYGWSKLTGEYLSHLAATRYGIKVACVRPFSGYGEDQDLSYPVPAIAYRVARGDDPITVWGDGRQGRDFVHIEDCITAMILAIERIQDGSAINIGSGHLRTFLDVAELFTKLEGRSAAIKPLIDKPVGVQSRYCNPTHMERTLSWKPAISLEEGFTRVLRAAHERVARLGSTAIE